MPDIDSNSVCPPVRCSKKQLTHRKADGGETSSEWAKRPGVETYRGETSKGRNVQGAKRPGGKTSSEGAKRQRGKTSCYRFYDIFIFLMCTQACVE